MSINIKISSALQAGDINSFFARRLHKMADADNNDFFIFCLKKAKKLSYMGIDSKDKMNKFISVKRHMKKLCGEHDDRIIIGVLSSKYSMDDSNDIYYSILKESIKQKNIKKVAYPNMTYSFYDETDEEFNVNAWVDIVHKIYKAVSAGDMTKNNAVDYYSNLLDIERDEDLNFKRWFKYYSDGDHLKYSSLDNKEDKMEKKALYGFSPIGLGNYSESLQTFDGAASHGEREADGSKRFSSWKSKLHAACRRIDKLLRTDLIESEEYKNLAELLMHLSFRVTKLSPVTASDLTYQAANRLKKAGADESADILIKLAQEAPGLEEANMPAEPAPAPEAAEVSPVAAEVPTPGEGAEMAPDGPPVPDEPSEAEARADAMGVKKNDEAESVPLEKITPIPGAAEGEYAGLTGDINLDDAATKLDEVAGMLADRRIIRLLAEFDIMLDRLGIASMFPELAESQSKLIDSYSYALTRVTKMMGQLSNAKTLVDSQKGTMPGVLEEESAVPEPEGDLGAEEETMEEI